MTMSEPHYQQDEYGNLVASRCRVCGEVASPPRVAHCGESMEVVGVAAQGTIEAATVVRIAAEVFKAPYGVAFVRLDSGPRVVARMEEAAVDGGDIAGKKVTLRLWSVRNEASEHPAILWASLSP